jgi:hypothetical protein
MVDTSIKWSEVSAEKEQAWRKANDEMDAARDASNLAKERLAADPNNETLKAESKAASALLTAKVEASNAALDAMSTTPSPEQAAVPATSPLPVAASGETTAILDNTQGTAATRSQAAEHLADTDSIAGLTPTRTNATPGIATEQRINQETGETYTGLKSEANYPQEKDNLSEKTASDTKVGSPTATSTKPVDLSSPNLLHAYASYTYSLSLHVLSGSDYTSMMNNPGEYVPTNVLIASAGRRGANADMARNAIFNEDFFFDKLELETVIGLNAQAKNSNAIHLSFTLIEPYGMTLINRLLALSELTNLNVNGNYVALPYLLVIDFFGYDDDGIPEKITGITKYIPIRLLTLGMKVSQKGAEYNITAVPFNHQAFSETIVTVPFKLEVAASNISDYFLADPGPQATARAAEDAKKIEDVTNKQKLVEKQQASLIKQRDSAQKGINAIDKSGVDADRTTDTRKELNATIANTNKQLETLKNPTSAEVLSFTGAFNAWKLQQVKDQQADYADQILFRIDPEIAKGKFPNMENVSLASTKMTKSKDLQQNKATDAGFKGDTISQMTIGQGTSVLEVINLAIKNSTYIYDQVIDPAKIKINATELKAKLSKPLNWFKVIPRVELGQYDNKRNDFQKTVTYQIISSTVVNTKSEDAPQGGPKEYVKDYQYIFTGKNYDVLNFDLKFDTLYWCAKTANPASQESVRQAANETGPMAPSTDEAAKILEEAEVRTLMDKAFHGDKAFHPRTVIVGQIPGHELGKGSTTESIKRLNNNILTNPSGDMISVDLRIIGDPDFIKQDDYFFGPGDKSAIFAHKTPNHSIITDANEVFVNLAFNTPGDYDDTGLARPNSSGPYSVNSFSGLYRVLTVKSYFSHGKFEQELKLIRHPSQETKGIKSDSSNVSQEDRPTDAKDARQETITSLDTSTKPDNLITATPAPVVSDIQTASIGPAESSASSNSIANMGTTGNEIDVDKTGGIGTSQNLTAAPQAAPFSDVDGKSTEPATKFNNSALRRIDEQRNENADRQAVVNQQLNTYPVGSEEFNAAKREDKLLRDNAKNINFNEQTIKNEISAAANGARSEATPITASSPTGESIIPGTAAPTVTKEITTFQPAPASSNPALVELKIATLDSSIKQDEARLAALTEISNAAPTSRQGAAADIERRILMNSLAKDRAELIAAKSGK